MSKQQPLTFTLFGVILALGAILGYQATHLLNLPWIGN